MELCRTLCKSTQTNIDMIEHLLANTILKAGKCDRDIYRAFEDSIKQLGKSKNTGIAFFNAWIKVENSSHLDNIIRNIRGNRLSSSAEKELFHLVDKQVPYESTSEKISIIFREIKEWANDIGEMSQSAALYDLRKNMKRERKAEKVLSTMYEFSDLKLEIPDNYLRSQYFENLAQSAADFCDPEVHMAFLHLFDIQDIGIKQEYIKAYVDEVLNGSKRKQLAYSMLSLCEAFYYEYKIPGKKAVQVKESADMLKAYFVKTLPNHYKPNLPDQVAKANYDENQVKKMLITMLQDAAKKAPRSGLFGWIIWKYRRK